MNGAIGRLAGEIRALSEQVTRRRQVWATVMMKKVEDWLGGAIEETDVGLFISKSERNKNMASIRLATPRLASGIVGPTGEGGMHAFLKEPGYLNFTPAMNGKIRVVVHYPYVEGISREPPGIEIDRLEPEDLTAERVTAAVVRFLEEMVKWEREWEVPPD